jgi:hypothetical protein
MNKEKRGTNIKKLLWVYHLTKKWQNSKWLVVRATPKSRAMKEKI